MGKHILNLFCLILIICSSSLEAGFADLFSPYKIIKAISNWYNWQKVQENRENKKKYDESLKCCNSAVQYRNSKLSEQQYRTSESYKETQQAFKDFFPKIDTIPDYSSLPEYKSLLVGLSGTVEQQAEITRARTALYKLVQEKSEVTCEQFKYVLERCHQLSYQPKWDEFTGIDLNNKSSWVNRACPGKKVSKSSLITDTHFAKKLFNYVTAVKFKEGTTIRYLTDLHGDCKSTKELLKELIDEEGIIRDPTVRIITTGDMVDKGAAGVEVLYFLILLRLLNPYSVFLVKGNHEELGLNKKDGFEEELEAKFGKENLPSLKKALGQFYKTLPLAIFTGLSNNKEETKYGLACHGGPDPRFNTDELFALAHKAPLDKSVHQLYPLSKPCSGQNGFFDQKVCNEQVYDAVEKEARIRYDNPSQYKEVLRAHFECSVHEHEQIAFMWQYLFDEKIKEAVGLPCIIRRDSMCYRIEANKGFVDALFASWACQQGNHTSSIEYCVRGHQQCGGNHGDDTRPVNRDFSDLMLPLFKSGGAYQGFTGNVATQLCGSIMHHSIFTLMAQPNNYYGQPDGKSYPGYNYATAFDIQYTNTGFAYKTIRKPVFQKPAGQNEYSIIENEEVCTYLAYEQN